MAARKGKREERKLKVITYAHVGTWGNLVKWENLTPEQKQRGAAKLSAKYLNTLYAGKAEFWPEGYESKEDFERQERILRETYTPEIKAKVRDAHMN